MATFFNQLETSHCVCADDRAVKLFNMISMFSRTTNQLNTNSRWRNKRPVGTAAASVNIKEKAEIKSRTVIIFCVYTLPLASFEELRLGNSV